MAKRRLEAEPTPPEIRTCPRCGNNILLGDTLCSRCGYNTQSSTDWLRQQPPNVIAFVGFAIGVLVMIAALGMSDTLQMVMVLIGFGFIVGGGMFYALHLFFFDDSQERKNK